LLSLFFFSVETLEKNRVKSHVACNEAKDTRKYRAINKHKEEEKKKEKKE